MQRILVVFFAVLLNGCVTNRTELSSKTQEAIALCGAGLSASVGASLEAKIAEKIAQGGSIKGSLESEIRAAIFKGTDASNANTVSAYDKYLSCIGKIRS
jgi:hypothetical protein